MTRVRFSQAVADRVLDAIASGASLRQALAAPGTPSKSTWLSWVNRRPALAESYRRAMDFREDSLFDEIRDTAHQPPALLPTGGVDRAEVEHRKLKIWSLMWALACLAPRRYGKRAIIEATVREYVQTMGEAPPDHNRARARA
jgi:hypothetical protein